MRWGLLGFRVKQYVAHWWQAKGIYRAHSPRIFQLYRQVLLNKQLPDSLVQWHRDILRSQHPLIFSELGAGQDAKGSKRIEISVGQLAKRSGAGRWKARVLHHLVRHTQPRRVLEFGTNVGIASGYMALALPDGAQLTSVEGVPALAAIAQKHIEQLGIGERVRIINARFEEYLDGLPTDARFDLLYIDGDHTCVATLRNLTRLKAHLNAGAVVIVDDIYWSPDMARAWAQLCGDSDFTISADLFHIGLLYYRVPQAPQHFVLKSANRPWS